MMDDTSHGPDDSQSSGETLGPFNRWRGYYDYIRYLDVLSNYLVFTVVLTIG